MSATQNGQRTSQRTSQRPAEHATPNGEAGAGTKFGPSFKPDFSECFNGNKFEPTGTVFVPIFEPNFSNCFNNNCYRGTGGPDNNNNRGGEPTRNGTPNYGPEMGIVVRATQNGGDHAQYSHRTNGVPRGYSRTPPRGSSSIRGDEIYCEAGTS